MQIYRSLLLNSYNYLTNIIVGGFLLIRSVFAQAILRSRRHRIKFDGDVRTSLLNGQSKHLNAKHKW